MSDYSNKQLHIISMDVPYPPDYGGVIDVFYKVKALAELGIKIHLHCFQYGRPASNELNKHCASVHYYPRKTGIQGISLKHPYMMYSRRDDQLLQNLLAIDAPILIEGVYCAYYLNHPQLKDRRILMRNHNIETDYFRHLQYKTDSIFKQLYYKLETRLLQRTEAQLGKAHAFITVSQTDYDYFQKLYPQHIHTFIPCFTENTPITLPKETVGKYVLYQGNLGHPENHEAAMYLLKEIIPHCPNTTFIFAGKAPQQALLNAAHSLAHVTISANPDANTMEQLIKDAQIHLLLTFQATGLKLKLLAAFLNGKHIIANDAMLLGTNLETACIVANTPQEIISAIQQTITQPYTDKEVQIRIKLKEQLYDTTINAKKIAAIAFT